MSKTYITFGQEHVHTINGKTFDKDCVALVNLPEEKAREIFMPKFCFSYTEDRFNHDDLKYFPRGIVEVEGSNSEIAELLTDRLFDGDQS